MPLMCIPKQKYRIYRPTLHETVLSAGLCSMIFTAICKMVRYVCSDTKLKRNQKILTTMNERLFLMFLGSYVILIVE